MVELMHRYADVYSDVLEGNERYHQAFDRGDLMPLPRKSLAVLTCMDCRIDTVSVFGLDPGDAHAIRNAGARATDDAIRSLIVSTIELGVRRIAVVHHTHCGAASVTTDQLRSHVVDATGNDPAEVDFALFSDPEQALRSDVERIAACPYLPPGTIVAGFMYDVTTGRIRVATGVLEVSDPTATDD